MTDWEKRYRSGEQIDAEPHPLVTKFVSSLTPGLALDVACGTGRHALWLAERGWQVIAVDSSPTAIQILQQRAREKTVHVDARIADLERHEFIIEPEIYNLIIICNYLQRDLFELVRKGTRIGGIVIAIIATVDDDPNVKPMNPAYLLNPGELKTEFEGWGVLHSFEGKPIKETRRRATAEVIARRLG